MEIKALTIAGGVPGLHSYLPWRGQEEGEEAAAVIFPLGVVFGFTFLSPKTRGAGGASQVQERKREGGLESENPRERALQSGRWGGWKQVEEASRTQLFPFLIFSGHVLVACLPLLYNGRYS